MEREYTVPLRRGFVKSPRHKRAKKAMTILREFLIRHTKADVKIGQHLNETIWQNGMKNPPGKVKVKALIEEVDGVKIAKVELFGKDFKEAVKPLEKEEEATGLQGKIKAMTADKEPVEKKAKVVEEKKPVEKSEKKSSEKPVEKTTEKKAPANKTPSKKE